MTFNGQPHVGDWRQMRNCTWFYRLHKKVHPTKRFCAGCDKNFCSDLSESERAKWGLIKGVDLNHIKSHPNKKGAAKAYKEPVFLFPKMASHDVVLGNKLPNSQLPIGSHDVTKV